MPTRHVHTAIFAVALCAGPALAQSDPPPAAPRDVAAPGADILPLSARPAPRPVGPPPTAPVDSAQAAAFDDWISAFRGRALVQGVSPAAFDRAFAGISYDPEIIARDRNQSEFTKTIWDYLDSAVSDSRVANGRTALDRHGDTLEAIESRYGVDKEVVAAIWGLESAYGSFRGDEDVVQSLATLAFDGRRGAFFEAQLVAALKIVDSNDVAPRDMTGSWAGAMGHTQFMPTSYQTYAVDFTGDGRRDIWSEDPTDALASTAAYLNRFGWEEGQPWGVEVTLPPDFDYAQASRRITRAPSEWAEIGVRGMDGAAVPDHGAASILLPAGAMGAAFMVFDNFGVIERYNTADAYVIGVGLLSDRLSGADPLAADWPRDDRALTFDERRELQRLLTSSGFDTRGIDGRIGPLTISAVRSYQRDTGMIPDGYASLRILRSLREGS